MPKQTQNNSNSDLPPVRPATTPEGREKQMIAYATDLAEQQLRDGTASSQVITFYLKLGASITQLEKEKLEKENALLRAKAEALESAKHSEELFKAAIDAFRSYSGNGGDEDDEYDY